MLADKDRIFTNLYGQHDWGLEGARARGAWDGTKAILDKGRDGIINEMKASGLRGRGGAGFPTGLKWSFMPKQIRRPAALSRRQCRRVGARHLQGSRDHAARSASPGRGLPDRRLRHGRAHLLHLHPRRIHPRARAAARRRSSRPTRPSSSARTTSTAGTSTSSSITAPAPTSAARRRRCSKASKARRAMPRLKPPFPANMGLYGCPTTVNNVETIAAGARHHAPRRRLVRRHRPAEQYRHQAVLHLRPRRASRATSKRRWAFRCAS